MPNRILACLTDTSKIKTRSWLALLTMACFPLGSYSQEVAIKSNVVSDALLSPNIGIEFGLSPKWTLDVTGQLNLWTVGDGHKWRHWVLQPEAAIGSAEFCGTFLRTSRLGRTIQRRQHRHGFQLSRHGFLSIKAQAFRGLGNRSLSIAYGYAWPLSRHWNLEAEFGFGWVWTKSNSFPCEECGTQIDHGKVHNYVGPTKVAINIEYVF